MGELKRGSVQNLEREEVKVEKIKANETEADEIIKKIHQEMALGKERINRKELEKALQAGKQLEKEQRQEEYEEKLLQETEELHRLAVEMRQMEMGKKIEELIDKVQNMAFMEGYRYAIAILEESMVHME